MAWATVIVSDEQVQYRVAGACGCDEHQSIDAQVDYRLRDDLAWIGSGLGEVGLVAGGPVDPEHARALMDGAHPSEIDDKTKKLKVLLAPKQAMAPEARVAAAPFVATVRGVAEAAGITPAEVFASRGGAERFARLERGLLRDGDAHTIPINDLEELAGGVRKDVPVPGLDAIYPAEALESAREHRDKRVTVGIRGIDVVLDLPKSVSVLHALADPQTSKAIEAEYLAAVGETVTALESWASYGVSGHHGDGKTAQRVDSSGFIGWSMLHRTARPVGGVPGDPHLHAHAVLAHMVKCVDGENGTWRAPGSGGRDIHRHVPAAGQLVRARVRARLSERFGVTWQYEEVSKSWEVAGIPVELRAEFSRRHEQIIKAGPAASAAEQRVVAARLAEKRPETETVADIRATWRTRAETVVGDVDAVIAAAMPGRGPTEPVTGPDGPDLGPTTGPTAGPAAAEATARGKVTDGEQLLEQRVADVAARVWDPETGLTANTKAVTRAQVLAAVAGACPDGVSGHQELEELTDLVIAAGPVLPVAEVHASHHHNTQRWTTLDIVDAERTVLAGATDRLDTGHAQVSGAQAEASITAWQERTALELSGEQRAAVIRLTTTGHGVDALIGVAGAGKTTIMAAARQIWDDASITVNGAATAAVAAQGLHTGAGISSVTIASVLTNLNQGGQLPGGVLVVDEAAMVDDRHLARLTTAAESSGTKLVLIGDPLQLRAIGVGGVFAAVHQSVGGLLLEENRRQSDQVERAALATWRDGARRSALATLAGDGRVHVTPTPAETLAEMAGAWIGATEPATGPHERIGAVLLMAARTVDVDTLNALVRAHQRQIGALGDDVTFELGAKLGGHRVVFAPGDLVRIRHNDYRHKRSRGAEPDVLNGYRGVAQGVDPVRGVLVEWTRPDPHATDGAQLVERAWVSPVQIGAGHLSHGYALTVAAAQGITCDQALLYGANADAHVLYPGLSRARTRTDLWIPATIETEQVRAALGRPGTPEQQLARVVAALGNEVEDDRPDTLITPQLLRPATTTAGPAVAPAASAPVAKASSPDVREALERLSARLQAPLVDAGEQERMNAQTPDPARRPYGRVATAKLPERLAEAAGAHAKAQAHAVERRAHLDQVTAGLQARTETKLAQLREQLARVDEHAQAAGEHTRQAALARAQAAEVNAQINQRSRTAQGLREQASKPLAVFSRARLNTQAQEVEAQIQALRVTLNAHRAQAGHHEQGAATAQREAAQAGWDVQINPGESTEQGLNRLAGGLRGIDDFYLSNARMEATMAERAVAKAAKAVPAIQDEIALRTAMTPTQAGHDDMRRSRAQAEAAAAAKAAADETAEESAGLQRRRREERHRPPSHYRDGPSRGFGR